MKNFPNTIDLSSSSDAWESDPWRQFRDWIYPPTTQILSRRRKIGIVLLPSGSLCMNTLEILRRLQIIHYGDRAHKKLLGGNFSMSTDSSFKLLHTNFTEYSPKSSEASRGRGKAKIYWKFMQIWALVDKQSQQRARGGSASSKKRKNFGLFMQIMMPNNETLCKLSEKIFTIPCRSSLVQHDVVDERCVKCDSSSRSKTMRTWWMFHQLVAQCLHMNTIYSSFSFCCCFVPRNDDDDVLGLCPRNACRLSYIFFSSDIFRSKRRRKVENEQQENED